MHFLNGFGLYIIGCIYVLFMMANGCVLSHQKISALQGDFTGLSSASVRFGISVASVVDKP